MLKTPGSKALLAHVAFLKCHLQGSNFEGCWERCAQVGCWNVSAEICIEIKNRQNLIAKIQINRFF